MTFISERSKLELIYIDHNCCTIITSPSLNDKGQEVFMIITKLFIQPSCSENCSHVLLSPNHVYVLEDISYLHILEE